MKRPNSSSETLIPLCSPGEEKGLYGRGFQSMMDGLDDDDCGDEELCSAGGGHGGAGEKKRRLSVEQVRALEKNFEVENKLEPERKVRLAQELGLQPRQVAVWFQNRRARWKTKQLERDYSALKASYDALRSDFDSLQRDKDALLQEIKELKGKLAEDESPSFSSVKEEPVLSEDEDNDDDGDNKVAIATDNPDELPALIYKNGASTDSDSSAVLNDANLLNDENSPLRLITNSITPHHISEDVNYASWTASHDLAPTKIEGAFANYHHAFHHHAHPVPIMKIEEPEFEDEPCSSFFTEEQAPTLNWCYSDHGWN